MYQKRHKYRHHRRVRYSKRSRQQHGRSRFFPRFLNLENDDNQPLIPDVDFQDSVDSGRLRDRLNTYSKINDFEIKPRTNNFKIKPQTNNFKIKPRINHFKIKPMLRLKSDRTKVPIVSSVFKEDIFSRKNIIHKNSTENKFPLQYLHHILQKDNSNYTRLYFNNHNRNLENILQEQSLRPLQKPIRTVILSNNQDLQIFNNNQNIQFIDQTMKHRSPERRKHMDVQNTMHKPILENSNQSDNSSKNEPNTFQQFDYYSQNESNTFQQLDNFPKNEPNTFESIGNSSKNELNTFKPSPVVTDALTKNDNQDFLINHANEHTIEPSENTVYLPNMGDVFTVIASQKPSYSSYRSNKTSASNENGFQTIEPLQNTVYPSNMKDFSTIKTPPKPPNMSSFQTIDPSKNPAKMSDFQTVKPSIKPSNDLITSYLQTNESIKKSYTSKMSDFKTVKPIKKSFHVENMSNYETNKPSKKPSRITNRSNFETNKPPKTDSYTGKMTIKPSKKPSHIANTSNFETNEPPKNSHVSRTKDKQSSDKSAPKNVPFLARRNVSGALGNNSHVHGEEGVRLPSPLARSDAKGGYLPFLPVCICFYLWVFAFFVYVFLFDFYICNVF